MFTTTKSQKNNGAESSRVKKYVQELLNDEDSVVMVSELKCQEEGCPPVETVVAVFSKGTSVKYKIEKAIKDVQLEDVKDALAGNKNCDHH
jgi:hypothetical protein